MLNCAACFFCVIVKIHLKICGHGAETEWKITDRKLIQAWASVIQVGLVFYVP